MLRKIYNCIPGPCQQVIDSVWHEIPTEIKLGKAYSDMLQLLHEKDSWSQERIYAMQIEKMKELLCHAYHTTKFYHCLFDEAGFDAESFRHFSDINKIPSISKATVQANLENMLSTAFPAKSRLKMTTGGTSGHQLVFYAQKRFTKAREKAFFDYLWSKAGYDPRKSEKVVLRNDVLPKDELWIYNYRDKTLVLDPFHLTDENCSRIIKKLNECKIPFFHVYPSSVLMLSDYMKRTNDYLTYTPKAIFASSENLYTGQREIVENAFGCRLLLHYGHSEMCSVAGWCLSENHYHLEELYGYTELLDGNQEPIHEPGKIGEITATGFNNYVLPLIRYRTADYAAYENSPGKCGFRGRILREVEGRWLQEMLVTSKGNKISMTSINFHSNIFDHVKLYQFYQEQPGEVIMRIVKGNDYTEADADSIYNVVKEKIGEYIALHIQYVEQVEKSKNGKYRYIISRL